MRHYTNYELKNLDWDFMLQIHAEDDGNDDAGNDDTGNNGAGEDGNQEEKGADKDGNKNGDKPRTYTDDDVDRIVAKKFAKWQEDHKKDLEKAKEEARKYERMTKEQREAEDKRKAQEEAAKKDARIKELEGQIAMDSLRKSVAADVEAKEEGISATQDFLDLVVVSSDAETAKKNVEKLVSIILADRKKQEQKRATGRTPKSFSGGGQEKDPYDLIVGKYKR